jgi:uncharacterized membrane protein
LFGIGISTPLFAWLTGTGMFDMGVIATVIAVMALLWNMLFNSLFDAWLKRSRLRKNVRIRVLHAFLFELGLICGALPFIMWWLKISLWDALTLDIGLILFYLPYTYIYSLVYDTLRKNFWGKIKN